MSCRHSIPTVERSLLSDEASQMIGSRWSRAMRSACGGTSLSL